LNGVRCAGISMVCAFAWLILLAGFSPPAFAAAQAQTVSIQLRGQVVDEVGHPVSRAQITLQISGGAPVILYTDAAGRFEAPPLNNVDLLIAISKPGFFRIDARALHLNPGANDATFTLNHETELQEKVEVFSAPTQIDPNTTSHEESMVAHEILNTPVASSHDFQQSLRTMPQVVADSSGRLHVAGARQGQTEVMLDGFEINDPATGGFTSRLNVDAIQAVTVETGGYGAQYAHAGAGVLALDTTSGDDKWRFGATNFIPGVSVQQGLHLGGWYPRITFSGPIRKGRAWFSEAFTIQHTFTLIKNLPSGQNVDTEWAGDNLLRLQINLTPRNILSGNFLYNRTSNPELGLAPFTPLPTTTNAQSRRYFVSVKDQIFLGRTLVTVGMASDSINTTNRPQGTATYVITPSSAAGNYFQSLAQQSRRLQFVADLTSGEINAWGKHTISAGWNLDGLDFAQQAARDSIDYDRADGTLSEVASFSGAARLRMANTQFGAYAQDQWRPVTPVVLSLGMRFDWDRLIQESVVQPRLAMNWVPAGDGRMKFTLAWGEHYQPLNLALMAQGVDQLRSDVFYDPTGLVPLGPPVVSSFVVPAQGLQQPRSYNTTAEWDEKIGGSTFISASFLLREGRDGFAWESQPGGEFLLQNNRDDRFVSGEFSVRHSFGDTADIMVDYTRSRASSNEVLDPTLASLILASQQPGPLVWDSPNRVVSRGWMPVHFWGLLGSYFFEYRTGFPFSAMNELQQLVGPANSYRFPNYFSLDIGAEKRFHFHKHEWAIRVSAINLTNHPNPDSVVNDVDAPLFRSFAGGQGRAFTARLRLVTQH